MLEVNGQIVKSHSHKDIVGVLQAHSGPVQMVVSRSLSEDNEGEIEMERKKIVLDLEEKLAQQLSLNDQWRQEKERLEQGRSHDQNRAGHMTRTGQVT